MLKGEYACNFREILRTFECLERAIISLSTQAYSSWSPSSAQFCWLNKTIVFSLILDYQALNHEHIPKTILKIVKSSSATCKTLEKKKKLKPALIWIKNIILTLEGILAEWQIMITLLNIPSYLQKGINWMKVWQPNNSKSSQYHQAQF